MPFLPSLPEKTNLSDVFKAFPKGFKPLMEFHDEVLRGPSTTFYGSGALGGVVQLFPGEHVRRDRDAQLFEPLGAVEDRRRDGIVRDGHDLAVVGAGNTLPS